MHSPRSALYCSGICIGMLLLKTHFSVSLQRLFKLNALIPLLLAINEIAALLMHLTPKDLSGIACPL